jgi:hypothetical protein
MEDTLPAMEDTLAATDPAEVAEAPGLTSPAGR